MKNRRYFIVFVLLIAAFLCVLYLLGFEEDIRRIPRTDLVDYTVPVSENNCRFPLIEPYEENIKEYINFYRSLKCNTDMPNLASVDDNNVLTIHYELEPWKQSRTPSFRCTYQALKGGLSPNVTKYELSDEKVEIKPNEPTFVPHDQFVVTCRNLSLVGYVNDAQKLNESVFYVKTFAGFSRTKSIRAARADPLKPSLAMLVLDSTARNQFIRHMPRTFEFMQKLGFITLNGYVKVGDNSAVNLLPVLAGRSILPRVGGDGSEVLPEGKVDLENVDFLFDFMKERKCVTLFNDDILDVRRGLFHYPNETFEGFRRPPTDYYFRPYHLYNTRHLVFPVVGGQCMKNGDINVERYLDIWERFSLTHKEKCHFSFNFLTGLTHDESSNLGVIDNRLRTSLERLFANGAMKSTAFVIMGDHGNRIGSIQRSYVGRIEERMPMFSIYMPEAFRATHPEFIENLMFNANRLTSNFDVHATLKQIAMGEFESQTAAVLRGTSLFTERIPVERSCEEAGVPPNFCVCMEEKMISRLNRQSKEFGDVHAALKEAVGTIPCLNARRLTIENDRLQTLVLNQMVRHGLRNASSYESVRNVQAAMEIVFFDVTARVRTFYSQRSIDFRARVKHYVKPFTFKVASLVADIRNEKTNPRAADLFPEHFWFEPPPHPPPPGLRPPQSANDVQKGRRIWVHISLDTLSHLIRIASVEQHSILSRTMKFDHSSGTGKSSSAFSAFVLALMALLLCNAVNASNIPGPLNAFVDKPIANQAAFPSALGMFPAHQRPYYAYGKRSHQVELRSMSQFKNCYFSPIQCVLMERRR